MKCVVGIILIKWPLHVVKFWLLCCVLFCATYTQAGTSVSLYESFAGNVSFEMTGGSFRTTQNDVSACTFGTSSSNPLSTLPINADIKKAYLYWAASGQNASYIDSSVTLNGQTAIASRTYTEFTGTFYFYSAVADVTSQVKTSRNANYTVANMDIFSSQAHCQNQTALGGWALAVIFEDDAEDFRVLNLYEGFSYFQQNFTTSSLTLTPANFTVPANPNGRHAHITWEGDDDLDGGGEDLTFNNNPLFDGNGTNDRFNQFDSYSNVEGGLTTYGVDIDIYDISAYLVEGGTSVTTTYSAGQDGVLLSAEIISVSNIPVADLSVTTSNPTGWLQGSTVTKKFTITNSGPNEVPAQSTRFTTTLPSQLTFSGTQGNSDWNCTQSGQQLSCIYQPKLRSGWSDYLDLTFDVASGTAGQTATWDVVVDHDLSPYDIFDNHAPNDSFTVSAPIVATEVVDLSASSKTYSNLSGDSILAGDTLEYTITIDDTSSLATSGIQLYDDLPANISGFTITALPAGAVSNSSGSGGANGTGYLDIQNISVPSNGTAQVIFEVTVDANAQDGDSLQNTADLSYNGNDWIVDTGEITVVEPNLTPSTIELSDIDGGLFVGGDVIDVVITLDDLNDLDINNLQVTGDFPAYVTGVNIVSIPNGAVDTSTSSGGSNGTGALNISNINIAPGDTQTIQLQFSTDPNTPEGTVFDFSNVLTLGSSDLTIDSNELTVQESYTPTSGNKQLYIDTTSSLSRTQPADGTTDINPEAERSWSLTPLLQSDLTFNLTDIAIEMKVEGNRNNFTLATITYTLTDTDGNLLASQVLNNVSIRSGRIDDVSTTLDKNPALADEYTVAAGKGLVLTIRNDGYNNSNASNRRITLHILDGTDNSKLADGYSALIINATTVINVDNIEVWSAAYADGNSDFIDDSGATLITQSQPDTELSVRATVSDPFGAFDITNAAVTIEKNDGSFYDFSGSNTATMTAIDDPSDDTTTGSKVFEMPFTLQETGEIINGWTVTVSADEGVEGDVSHTGVVGFTVLPFQPSIEINKSVDVTYDPVLGFKSAGNKPKAIPGAELLYSVNVVNTGRGKSDDGSLILQDTIPANSELFIGNLSCLNRGPGTGTGPICYEDGNSPNESNLTYNFVDLDSSTDHISFSQDGFDFSYEPVDSGDGYDPTVRYIRIFPSGEFKESDKNNTYSPEFTFSYQIKLN